MQQRRHMVLEGFLGLAHIAAPAKKKEPAPIPPRPEIAPEALQVVVEHRDMKPYVRRIDEPAPEGHTLLTLIYKGAPRDYVVRNTAFVHEVVAQALDEFEVDLAGRAFLVALWGSNQMPAGATIDMLGLPKTGKPPKAWLWLAEQRYASTATIPVGRSKA